MPWISRLRTAERADDEWSNRGLEAAPVVDPLREQLELDAVAGRITWAEFDRRMAALKAAKAARDCYFAEAA